MRTVQNLLLVAGTTSLGACAGVLALIVYAAATGLGSHHGPSDLGAAGLAFLLLAGIGALGAIVGLTVGIWWIVRHDRRLWTTRIWVGVTLGLVTGFMLHSASKLPRVPKLIEAFEPMAAAAVLSVALAALGGLAAKLTGWRRTERPHRCRHVRRI
jgi:hypothetical protein